MTEVSASLEYYNQAWLAFQSTLYKNALELLERSIAIDEHFKTRELMALCHKELGNIPAAIDNLELAYKLNEKSSKSACLLAELLVSVGEISRARALLEKVLCRQYEYGPAKRLISQLNG